MSNLITGIISITISAVILANVFVAQVKHQNTSVDGRYCSAAANQSCPWSASEVAMWGLLTLLSIVGLVYGVLSVFGLA